MDPVTENIEIERNNFSKLIYLGFTALSALAFFISFNKAGNNKWISFAGIVLFVSAYWTVLKSRITIGQDGFTMQGAFRSTNVFWKDIRSLSYETVFRGHTLQLNLMIKYGNPQRQIVVPVKQYKKQPMQRFFEILNERCPLAIKNDHFIKQATGKMSWKDKMKMY